MAVDSGGSGAVLPEGDEICALGEKGAMGRMTGIAEQRGAEPCTVDAYTVVLRSSI